MNTLNLFLVLFSTVTFCQTWQTTSIQDNTNGTRYDDVFFLDNTTGWAANGENGTVNKTTDGGITWTEQLNETILGGNFYFRNIEFLDANIGFLGTLNSKFYSTNDGGTTWNLVTNISPNPPAICGLDAIGNSTIYGCGAYFEPAFIIKSVDSGANWQYIDMSSHATALVEILFTSETTGYACGKNASGACILKTTDGGTTWTEIYNSGVIGEYVWKLQILNDTVFFGAVTSIAPNLGKLIKSNDAGTTWTSFDAPETDIQAVGFINENKGWMGGHNTGFYETNDGGQNWTNINVGARLNKIFIINQNLAYASGGSIYKYTDEVLSNTPAIIDKANSSKKRIILTSNPVKSSLNFTIDYQPDDNILIELYDTKGQFVRKLTRERFNKAIKKDYSFDVGNLPSGIYFINFHHNYNRESYKFIKE